MRILIDMDEITVNLTDEWLRIYNQEWDDDLTREKITSWAMHEHVVPECGRDVYKILQRPGLFDHLPPMDGAIEAITEMVACGHIVKFATSPPSADAARGKIEWVTRHFKHLKFGKSDMMQLEDKEWLAPSVDVMIDDKPAMIQKWRDYADLVDSIGNVDSPRIMTIAHHYNQDMKKVAHVFAESVDDTEAAWGEIITAIHDLDDERS